MVTTRTLETIAALLFHGGYLKEMKTVFIFCPFVVYAYSCQASWPLYHLAFRFLPGWFDLVWWCCCVTIFVAGAAFGDVALQIWEVAGARNADFFHTKCPAEGGKVSLANGRVQFCNFMAPHVWQVSCILPSQRWQALPGAMFGRWRGLAQRCEHACERWTKCCDISIGNFFLWTYRQVPCWNFHPRLARFTCIRTFKKGPNIRPGLQASGSANLSPDQ